MSTTKMPETIVAWVYSEAAPFGCWGLPNPAFTTATPYTRSDLVEAERAECIEVLRAFVSWHEEGMSRFSPEYRAEALSKGALVEFGGVPLTSQPFLAATALLSKLEAKS